jgi:NTP pyrophosphatase (non-canonical NTP hydrolase)
MNEKVYLDWQAKFIHTTAKDKGFWDGEIDINFLLAKLALVHSEVSETLEALRKRKGSDEVAEEIADVLIRLLDFYAGAQEAGCIDDRLLLTKVVQDKMDKNASRPRLHNNLI